MGRIVVRENLIFIATGYSIIYQDTREDESRCIQLPDVATNIDESIGKETSASLQISNQFEDECTKNFLTIAALVISKDGKILSCITQNKRLIAWRTEAWDVILNIVLRKRPMSLSITPDSDTILVADKTGDVYKYPLNLPRNNSDADFDSIEKLKSDSNSKPILGHLSMLLDMIVSEDGKYVLTCDRDEKIRVSCYPNCYNIQSFCLGHEEFVSQILQVPTHPHLIVSGSGDMTVRLWNFNTGQSINVLDVQPLLSDDLDRVLSSVNENNLEQSKKDEDEIFIGAITKMAIIAENEEGSLLALSLHRLPMLILLRVTGEQLQCISTIKLDCIPEEFCFLSSKEMFVVKQSNASKLSDENPILILNINHFDGNTSVTIATSHHLLEFGRKHLKQLTETGTPSLDVKLMQKHQYDNMGHYLKQKEERLSEKETGIKRKHE